MSIRDDRTPNLNLPLPYYDNLLEDDESRLREALTTLDTVVAGKQAALGFAPLNAAQKGAVNGVAPLGSDSKVPATYLPSYVDDVIEVANQASLPVTGETGKIYVTLDLGRQFRWSGTAWVELHPSPGTTDDIIEGQTNKFFTNERALAAMPAASNSVLGLVKVGAGLGVDGNGLLYAAAGGGSYMEILEITPASNGVSSVTVTGGYVVGGIVVMLNGSLLAPSDYTATNTTTVNFVGFTVNTTDRIVVVKLSTVQIGTLPAGSVGTSQLAGGGVTAAKLDGAQSGSAPIYGARAWVNFNGTGTVAIRASGNVSSVTDNGVGDYTVNFTTAMPDANYAAPVSFVRPSTGTDYGLDANVFEYATSSVRVVTRGSGNVDAFVVALAIFR